LRKAKLGAVTGVLFFALVAVALALTNNTVTYNSTLTKGKHTKLGTNTAYEGILHVSTDDGKQPNTAPLTEVFFAKQIKNNAPLFPSCKASDIDGKSSVPAKCQKAVVGDGTASSLIGGPGYNPPPCTPPNCAIRQDLVVTAYNGNKGKQILLAVTGGPVNNRVITGTISKAPAPFGYKVGFQVPADLQEQLGAQIALTDFDVNINSKKTAIKKIHVKGKKKKQKVKVSYLQLKSCPASGELPNKAIVHFNNDDNSPGGPVVPSETTIPCK
jgi:hypothetical protein